MDKANVWFKESRSWWDPRALTPLGLGRGYPKVTGVLPVALENATKIIGNVMYAGKEYICVMQLHEAVPREKLEEVVSMFKGEIYQRPPVRSSVKRSLRIKKIYDIELLEVEGKYALLRVSCEAGTYMRKLCHDIGEILGVGAHMRELRRTRSGPFREDRMLVKMHEVAEALYAFKEEGREDLLRKVVMPAEYAVCFMPKVIIRDTAVDALAHGADLAIPGIVAVTEDFKPDARVAVLTLKGELVAIAKSLVSIQDLVSRKRGIACKLLRVIMPKGIYPRAWKSRSGASTR